MNIYLQIFLWVLFLLWDFRFELTKETTEGTKYFVFIYHGLIWAILKKFRFHNN